jgi:hypothetical protein
MLQMVAVKTRDILSNAPKEEYNEASIQLSQTNIRLLYLNSVHPNK